nr:helix-turn-helix transcriptional regulator [Mesorhizobium sp. M1A.F.Ca.IN.020.06.1.1]
MDIADEAKPKDDADVRVGRRVRALRLERKLSLAELAAKAGISIWLSAACPRCASR